jgi:hypothetical protein
MQQNFKNNRALLCKSLVTMSSLILLSACQIQGQPSGAGQCAQACSASNDCSLGQVCSSSGCCEAFQASTGPCESGHPDCTTIDEVCDELSGGCVCEIIANGDYQLADILPTVILAGPQITNLDAKVSAAEGDVITHHGFTLYADDPSCITIDANQIVGSPYPCSTTLVAEFGKAAICEAHILNVGEPSSDSVRVLTYDESTGAPVARATVIIDQNNDGQTDAIVPTTSETGMTHFELGDEQRASLTVMAKGYHYVSFIGLTLEEGKTLHIPLTPVNTTALRSGVSGTIDFSAHRENQMNGLAESIQLALVAPSFPLRSLVQFDIDTILGGPMPSVDCVENAGAPGCYDLGIPGVTNQQVPLWGGMFFSFQASAMKPFFEIRSSPGSRALWSLGGEWSYEEIAPLAERMMAAPECITDLSTCLKDYRYRLASSLLRDWSPMMARLSFGFQSNLPLHSMHQAEWDNYINTPYGPERSSFSQIPLLDSAHGSRHTLELKNPATNYTEIILPELPMGPVGHPTDALIALTGVTMNGSGFIPTGVAAGFDCYGDDCHLNRDGHDQVLNGQPICPEDSSDDSETCGENILGHQAAGTIGLFHAKTDESLQEHTQKTIIMAMPLDVPYEHGLSATGLILEGSLPQEAVNLEGLSFPSHLELELAPETRSITMGNSHDNLNVITVYPAEENREGPHWTIYAKGNSSHYTLPNAIGSFGDPLASIHASRFLRCSNMYLKSGNSIENSLSSSRGMNQLFNNALGFATHHQTW